MVFTLIFFQLLAAGLMKPAPAADAWGDIKTDVTTDWYVGGEQTIQLRPGSLRDPAVADSSISDRVAQFRAFAQRMGFANLGNHSKHGESSSSADNSGDGDASASTSSSAPASGRGLSSLATRRHLRKGNAPSDDDSADDADSDDSSGGMNLYFYFHHAGSNGSSGGYGGSISGGDLTDHFSLATNKFFHHQSISSTGGGISSSLPTGGGGLDDSGAGGIGVGSGFNHGGIPVAPEPSSLTLIAGALGATACRRRRRNR